VRWKFFGGAGNPSKKQTAKGSWGVQRKKRESTNQVKMGEWRAIGWGGSLYPIKGSEKEERGLELKK